MNAPPTTHYRLLAYICGRACTKPAPFDGWADFHQIFFHRPSDCRYAVVERAVQHPAGRFVCWDFYHDELTHITAGKVTPPPALWVGDSGDGLIMKAMALYDRA